MSSVKEHEHRWARGFWHPDVRATHLFCECGATAWLDPLHGVCCVKVAPEKATPLPEKTA